MNNKGIKELYRLRRDFSIIGLTGRKGSGCSEVANLLSNSDISKFPIRTPNSFKCDKMIDHNFLRKYKICYEFANINWTPYKVIKYRNAVLLHFLSIEINEIIKSVKIVYDTIDEDFINEIKSLLNKNKTLLNDIKTLGKIDKNFKQPEKLYDIFFKDDKYNTLTESFVEILDKKDNSLRSKLFHKISNGLRSIGEPNVNFIEKKDYISVNNIYTVAETINRLIKAWKTKHESVHMVIDALRNSLEIMFFKERYSAFYMMSINSDFRRENLNLKIKKRINNIDHERLKKEVDKILIIDNTEFLCNDFKKGNFWAPDVQNCIQKCDIHLTNNKPEYLRDKTNEINKNNCDCNSFITIEEQLLKFTSLIRQPGLITPSSQERCMQVAYNAKSNSGCISRQVGAVITDSNYSIKSVGWNDIPSGSVPCNLRNIIDLVNDYKDIIDKESFSPFELGLYENDKESNIFRTHIINKYKGFNKDVLEGKNNSFCFKALYNECKGDSNQVHTRSLHAEENAMLQISKYGGQGIENGSLFTTASPCELCSKKSYQIGIVNIYYIDPYPGISERHIIKAGKKDKQPRLILFSGAVGRAFHMLYEPFINYKDELTIITNIKSKPQTILEIERILKTYRESPKKFIEMCNDLDVKNKDLFKEMSKTIIANNSD